ncbi:DUF4430 domain-containing protein [uncultured Adlercreutzia sp.]|uniref:DUF4430 domain-containing protein n=1 Tax=uncultured Adlercreutzia sp. TaxID=875803 RepID=UPI0026F39619|nr:DUF4430 domain-containing protein [uncultured Adlercreutzia sp.]
MNKFDLTKARPQWLVALVALMLTFALVVPGCASDTADDNAAETPTEKAAQAAEDEGPLEAGEAADDIVVPVSLALPEGADAEGKTIEVTVPDGATVLDALEATGWEVQSEDSEYGVFVTSINGIANGSEGEASGWVYTVNNEQVMEGCDAKTLAAGDSVQWSFYVG